MLVLSKFCLRQKLPLQPCYNTIGRMLHYGVEEGGCQFGGHRRQQTRSPEQKPTWASTEKTRRHSQSLVKRKRSPSILFYCLLSSEGQNDTWCDMLHARQRKNRRVTQLSGKRIPQCLFFSREPIKQQPRGMRCGAICGTSRTQLISYSMALPSTVLLTAHTDHFVAF